jgi:WD40 repeat protein
MKGDNRVSALAVSGDGKMLASGSYFDVVRLWELPSLKPRAQLPYYAHCVGFGRNEETLGHCRKKSAPRFDAW